MGVKEHNSNSKAVSAARNLPVALPHPFQPKAPRGAAPGCLLPPPSPTPGCCGERGLAPMGALPARATPATYCGLVWVQLGWARCK